MGVAVMKRLLSQEMIRNTGERRSSGESPARERWRSRTVHADHRRILADVGQIGEPAHSNPRSQATCDQTLGPGRLPLLLEKERITQQRGLLKRYLNRLSVSG